MSKIKIKKHYKNEYTTIDNTLINDMGLSFKAKGVFLYFWSKPDDWEIKPKAIGNDWKDGETVIYTALKELEDRGYLYRKRFYVNSKIAGINYHLSDIREFNQELLNQENLDEGKTNEYIYIQNKENNKINNNTKKNTKKENLNSILKTYNNEIEELINIFPKRSDVTKNDIETTKRHIGRALLESDNKELLFSEMKSGVDRYIASLKDMQYCKKVNKWFGEASWTASYENVSEVQNTPQKPLLSASKDDKNYFITVLNNELSIVIGYEWCEKYKMKYSVEKYKNRENLFALKDILKNEKEQDLSQIKNEFLLTFKNNDYSMFAEKEENVKKWFDELFCFIN